MVYQREPVRSVHGPDLLRKKSRSTVNCPIFSYNGASASSDFHAWIWLACTPNRLDSSATVPSSRTAASATFALNSGPCFFRVFDKSHLRPSGRSQGRLSLSSLSSFRGPPQSVQRPRLE